MTTSRLYILLLDLLVAIFLVIACNYQKSGVFPQSSNLILTPTTTRLSTNLTRKELEQVIEIPPSVIEVMTHLENFGPSGSISDPRVIGTWKNLEGYGISFIHTYEIDGTCVQAGFKRSFEPLCWYTTVENEGVYWIVFISKNPEALKNPEKYTTGRAVQLYYIEDDKLFMRFARQDSDWEIWERTTESSEK